MAAPLSIPFQAFYSASKSAVNSLTLALANELRPFNISVCAFMPGDVKTAFTQEREKETAGAEVYGEVIGKSIAQMEKDEQNGMSPEGRSFSCPEKEPQAAFNNRRKLQAFCRAVKAASRAHGQPYYRYDIQQMMNFIVCAFCKNRKV